MRNSWGWILCSMLLLLAGCRSSKQPVTGTGQGSMSREACFERLEEQMFQFETLSARLNVELRLPEKELSSRVELKLVRDSALQLSVQPFLGIELFRMELTTDSVKILDRMNKRYLAENYAKLQGETPIEFNFYNLQALFVNRLFLPGEQAVTKAAHRRFQWEAAGSDALLETQDRMDLRYQFRVDPEGKLLATHVQDANGQQGLFWEYTDFRVFQKQLFPHQMVCELVSKGTSQGTIQLNYARMQLNGPLTMSFEIPAKYTRVTFAQIVKAIGNLS